MQRIALLAALALAAPAFAGLTNGDFTDGNTGFQTDYAYRVVSDPPNVGQYGVTHSSFEWSQFWQNVPGDHTTGTGLFLIADVSGTANTADIWRQTVAVTPNTRYRMDGWLATWTSFAPATLGVLVDGVSVASWAAPGSSTWTPYSATIDTGSRTSITIALRPTTFFQPGDDVAIDDLALTAVPAPSALGLAAGALLLRRRRR